MLSCGEAAIYLIKKTIIIHSAVHLTVVVIVFVKFCRFKHIFKSLGTSTYNGIKLIPGPWTAPYASVGGTSLHLKHIF